MAVVGADDDVVLPGIFEDVGQIVVRLARHVHAVLFDEICQLQGGAPLLALSQEVDRVRHPLGCHLDKAEAQLRKLGRHVAQDQ